MSLFRRRKDRNPELTALVQDQGAVLSDVPWENVQFLLDGADAYLKDVPPDMIQTRDEMVTRYKQAFAEHGIDLLDEGSLYGVLITAATLAGTIEQMMEFEQCPELEHMKLHLGQAVLRFAIIARDLRRSLIP